MYRLIIILFYIFSGVRVYAQIQTNINCKDANQEYSSESIIVKFKDSKPKSKTRKFQTSQGSFVAESLVDDYLPKNNLGLDRTYKLSLKQDCSQIKNLVKQLNADPQVEYAELDLIAKLNSNPNDPLYNTTGSTWSFPFDEMWGAKRISADQAWNNSQGQGVVIALIDTGVDYNHPDLWDNIWVDPKLCSDLNHDGQINLDDIDTNHNHIIEDAELDRDYIGHDFAAKDSIPEDYNRHGTHLAGIIAATGNNNEGVIGVAFKSKIMVLKGFNDNGTGRYSDLAKAIISAADRGAHITNSAWGGKPSRTLSRAFGYAYNRGLINITAAGNNDNDAIYYTPANLATTISVGAINPMDDSRASFSNYGSSVDIAAPGAYITSTLSSLRNDNAGNFVGYGPTYQYWYNSGTSIASPFVAGVAALILSANPKLTNKQVQQILVSSAERISTDRDIGGLVNAAAAVTIAKKSLFADRFIRK